MKVLSRIYMFLVFGLLYAPIIVLVLYSFNKAGTFNTYSEFSLYWYAELFRDSVAIDALKNSLILAALSSVIATLIGTHKQRDEHPDDEPGYSDRRLDDASVRRRFRDTVFKGRDGLRHDADRSRHVQPAVRHTVRSA